MSDIRPDTINPRARFPIREINYIVKVLLRLHLFAHIASIFEETRVEGKTEGRAEEIIGTGYEFRLSEQAILERLQKKLAITPDKARE